MHPQNRRRLTERRESVVASRTLQDAIIRNLQVLCESVRRLDDTYKSKHSEIDWRSIAGMRNVLVHDYFEVDFDVVWQIIQNDLPPLEKAMHDTLNVLNQES